MFKTNFLTETAARALVQEHGTPLFVYSKTRIAEQCRTMLNIPAPYGLTVRYAMKANPNLELLKIMRKGGLSLDISSEYEASDAHKAGYRFDEMLLTTQQMPKRLKELVDKGVSFNACSLRQLEEYGKLFPGSEVSVRLNPGIGSGFSNHVTVGGRASSFGIWHEYIPEIHALAQKYKLKITRMHTQIGSGADPDVWLEAAKISLDLVKEFPSAEILNLGGGFKAARVDEERGADMDEVGRVLAHELTEFAKHTGRKLKLELEPGHFVTANCAVLVSTVDDIVDTGEYGHKFIKLDTGMNDFVRPAMYGSQHPIAVVTDETDEADYVVVGHNCESADVFTVQSDNPGAIQPRRLKKAVVGDIVFIGGVGAYCAAMAMHGYNGFPNAKEIFV
jgi:diaminopimelate decarboxylase